MHLKNFRPILHKNSWISERSESALGRLANAERPSESEEIWRYSIIDSLDFDTLVQADTYRAYEHESSNQNQSPSQIDIQEQIKTSLDIDSYVDYCGHIASQVVSNRAALVMMYDGICIATEQDGIVVDMNGMSGDGKSGDPLNAGGISMTRDIQQAKKRESNLLSADGISITPLPKEMPKGIESLDTLHQQDIFRLMNSAYGLGPVALNIAPDTSVEYPIVVVNISSSRPTGVAQPDIQPGVQPGVQDGDNQDVEMSTSFSTLSINIGKHAEASVVEILIQAPDDCGSQKLFVPATLMSIDDDAALNYVNIQLLPDSHWQIGYLESTVGRNAQLRSLGVSVGGSYARTLTTSTLAGEGGSSELMSAYIATDNQIKDMRTIQTHSARHTVSNLLFTGIAGGHSSTVYSGLIEIRPGAKGSNALQTNRNLILSEQAKADSVPNLTIEENDVHCNHASSTGPIDPEQIYYLESRGVDTDTARRLIAAGFFSDIYSKNPIAGITQFISSTIDQRLNQLVTYPENNYKFSSAR